MKFFICIALCVFAFVIVAAKPAAKVESEIVAVAEDSEVDASRYRKAAYESAGGYEGSYVPAPQCNNAYLFSCRSNVNPVPCAQQAHAGHGAYGSQGAYSAPVANVVYPFQAYDAQYYQY